MRKLSPTYASLGWLEAHGWTADIVERRIPGTNISKDLFGFGDILAIRGRDILIVQATSASNLAARVHKIADSPLVGMVREAGIAIHAHGWRYKGGVPIMREVDCS
jgi:hypothetical protein